ncbi:ABC transporter permease [Aggregatibacter actinomycetemcomitans]|uniref:ABC transporter permease n=1 Tax=Aggregatibacter actinomycetemcomitans TaxID=714 RepID=UPI00197B51E0|nr:iron ABC transporter permease [Aggregatibacter actinomycetemcomitans]MBN6079367.1 iron ABC transporter permease [Aggregatibacter actinomycetemcomitans]
MLKKQFRHNLIWILLAFTAFALLPVRALDYGIFGATGSEYFAALGWVQPNISWLWFAALLFFPFLSRSALGRPKITLFLAIFLGIFIWCSAEFFRFRFGYAIIFLALALGAILVDALARLRFMQGDRFLLSVALGLSCLVIGFIFYPIGKLFAVFFSTEPGDWQNISALMANTGLWQVVGNSLAVSASVGVVSVVFGLIFALYTTRIAKRSLWVSKIFSILPMVTPPFVVSLGVMLMFGRNGAVTPFLTQHFGVSTNWLYGFNGILISHTLALTPMAFMLIEGALKALSPKLEEAGVMLGANRWQSFRFIVLPLLKPALANAFLIVMVQSLADFSTPFVLGGNFDVLATQIYFYIVGAQNDYLAASTLGVILLAISLSIFWLQYRFIGSQNYVTVSDKSFEGRVTPLATGLNVLVTTVFILWAGFNGILYGSIFYGSFMQSWGINNQFTFQHYITLFGQGWNSGAIPSLAQTVLFALIAAPFTAISGFLLAYFFARRHFFGKKYAEFFTLLSFAVPGTVAGVSYILAFNHVPLYLTGTGAIIVLSMITRNMPIGLRAALVNFKQLDPTLDEAGYTLKASSFQVLRFILLPLLKLALLSALVTGFVRAMTTISAIIFLVTPSTRVATSYILNRVEDGDYGLAVAYGATFIVVMMLVIGLFGRWVGDLNLQSKQHDRTD